MPPISCIRLRTKGVRTCLGGASPLSFEMDSALTFFSLSLHALCWGCTMLGGSLCGGLGVWGPPPPLHAVRWERTLLGGCPLIFLLAQGVPLLPLRHAVRWERMLPFRGFPPFVRARLAYRGHARSVPWPLLPAHGLCALLGMGGSLVVLGPVVRGVPVLV